MEDGRVEDGADDAGRDEGRAAVRGGGADGSALNGCWHCRPATHLNQRGRERRVRRVGRTVGRMRWGLGKALALAAVEQGEAIVPVAVVLEVLVITLTVVSLFLLVVTVRPGFVGVVVEAVGRG